MTLRDLFGGKNVELKDNSKRIIGKIFHIDEVGWGFISSEEMKFTRIYFHWTGLNQDTLKFPELRKGMRVEFEPKDYQDKGWRAIKINVLKNDED